MRRARGAFPVSAIALGCLWVGSSAVRAQDNLAGNYRLAVNELRADVSTWGVDCGPRPESRKDPVHPAVEVRVQGTHLALALPERTLRTDACWSPNPSVRVVGATASAARWRVECRTPEGDPKREHGVYTLIASDSALELSDESEYDWQLKDSHCVAKVRVTQRLTREGVAPAPVAAEAPPPKEKCTPGPLARLRLRPSQAQIAPGERVCFSVRGFDRAGCALDLDESTLRWSLDKPEGANGTFARNCFKAAERAAEAEGRFELAVSSGDERAESTVTVSSVDLSDITARRGAHADDLASREEESEGIVSDLGIDAAVKRSFSGLPLALAALLLGCVAALAWLVHRRGQSRRRRAARHARASTPSQRASEGRLGRASEGSATVGARGSTRTRDSDGRGSLYAHHGDARGAAGAQDFDAGSPARAQHGNGRVAPRAEHVDGHGTAGERRVGAHEQRADVRAQHDVVIGDVEARGAARAQNNAAGSSRPARVTPSSDPPAQFICPTCRRGYPADTVQCPNDGSAPIPYAAFIERARIAQGSPRTCPACGAQLAAGALFCGACGRQVRA